MTSYSDRFRDEESVSSYDSNEYATGGYADFIWKLQQPILGEILAAEKEKHGRLALLDFACGSGRVLSYFEKFSDSSEGIDISAAMVSQAVPRCPTSRLSVGNICTDPSLADSRYHTITSFRFLLNVENEIREGVLRELRKRLSEDGLLIVNNHGNSRSVRHFSILLRKLRAKLNPERHRNVMAAEMSCLETESLLNAAGFTVIDRLGFGITPSFLHRTPLVGLCRWIDRSLAGRTWATHFAIDVIFLCRPQTATRK